MRILLSISHLFWALCIGVALQITGQSLFTIVFEEEFVEELPEHLDVLNLTINGTYFGSSFIAPNGFKFSAEDGLVAVSGGSSDLTLAWTNERGAIRELVVDSFSSDYFKISGTKISFTENILNLTEVGLQSGGTFYVDELVVCGLRFCKDDATFNPRLASESCSSSGARLLEEKVSQVESFGLVKSFAVAGQFVAVTDGSLLSIFEMGNGKQRRVYHTRGSGSVYAEPGSLVQFHFGDAVVFYSPLKREFEVTSQVKPSHLVNSLGYKITYENGVFTECLSDDCSLTNVVKTPVFEGRVRVGLDDLFHPVLVYGDARKVIVMDAPHKCKSYDIYDLDIHDAVDDFHLLQYTSDILVLQQGKLSRIPI